MNPAHRTIVKTVAGAGLFLALSAAVAITFLYIFQPRPPPPRIQETNKYNPAEIDNAMSPQRVREELDAILALGSRAMGQPGLTATYARIRQAFANAGLKVFEYPQRTAAPVTLRREIIGPDGKPLAGVEVYPFMPNHFQPIVTPAGGVSGVLVKVTDAMLLSATSFSNNIALIDAAAPPSKQGFNWIRYAQLGFRAVIVAHRNGLGAVPWVAAGAPRRMSSDIPVNYPRLAATEGIFEFIDKPVTLHVRVNWRNIDNMTAVGILHAPTAPGNEAREALLVTSCYDAASVLPDLAPGTLGAHNIAVQLAFLKFIAAHRDLLKRDVVFVTYASQTMAQLPADRLAALLGTALEPGLGAIRMEAEKARNSRELALARAVETCLLTRGFFEDPAIASDTLRHVKPAVRTAVEQQVSHVIKTIILDRSDELMLARLAFKDGKDEREGSPAIPGGSNVFETYQRARQIVDDLSIAAGYPVVKLVRERQELIRNNEIASRCLTRIRELISYHAWRETQIRKGTALQAAMTNYRRLIPVGSCLAPSDALHRDESLTFMMSGATESQGYQYSQVINNLMLSVAQQMPLQDGPRLEPLRDEGHQRWAAQVIDNLPVDTAAWNNRGHPAFVLVNSDRLDSYQLYGSPVDPPFMRNTETLDRSLRFTGRLLTSLAAGRSAFEAARKVPTQSFGGRVLAAGVGRSPVPDYGVGGALIGHKASANDPACGRGYYRSVFYFTDPYGRYSLPETTAPVVAPGVTYYSPEAVNFDQDGIIAFAKDEGTYGQSLNKSMNLGWNAVRSSVNIGVFRACPVSLMNLTNPKDFDTFPGIEFVTREGLAPVSRHNIFQGDGISTAFLPPDERCFITFKAGSADNPLIRTTRAFALNTRDDYVPLPDRDIDGQGYLPLRTPFVVDVAGEMARSMVQINARRLALQDRCEMSDERTGASQRRAEALLRQAGNPSLSYHARHLLEEECATLAMVNHPVLRRSIYEAISGILWYLGLLVPFVFFFEKLAFGFSDIRRQLAAQAVIFITVFMLLRWLHPAFQIVRSPLMILLGFVVLLISAGVTVLFSAKFRDNLALIGQLRGRVSSAQVDRLGVLGTAFALGLNNMHRRIVRTGLTCATLVLITFAMICFTSVESSVVNISTAAGRAPYQGFVVKREKMRSISKSTLYAIEAHYSHLYPVAARHVIVGRRELNNICRNPVIDVAFQPQDAPARKARADSILLLTPAEPLRDRIELATKRGWLPPMPPAAGGSAPALPILVPDSIARELGIRPEQVDTTDIFVTVNGRRCVIHGIFTAASLAGLRDLDDRSILPFDAAALRSVETESESSLIADDDEPRLSAERVLIAPESGGIQAGHGDWRPVSVAIHMPGLSYREARSAVEQYLDQSGRDLWYGIGDTAFHGKSARSRSFAGLLAILIPLIIAGVTVLNTMHSSVYERRDEIFVYNAVGIAPRYIFAMFLSEAFVYAVIGCEGGYILSQATGRLLAAFGWTGGLSMTFSSLQTIYVSMAIMFAVFASTVIPARTAMRIAATSDDPGWRLPEPDGDRMSFSLPFVFDYRDRIAVLAFFRRYLVDHGEGSSGQFFADPPRVGITTGSDPVAPDSPVPHLACTIWLKPFDLGVAQDMEISMPADAATREYMASVSLTRKSGSRESWLRLNRAFVTLLRQNFLYWRAVGPEERERLFEEAKKRLKTEN